MRELNEIAEDAERILAVCRAHMVRLSERRLELPAAPPHMIAPNFWMVNAPGSTLFIPIADASEQVLSLMAGGRACLRRMEAVVSQPISGKAAVFQTGIIVKMPRPENRRIRKCLCIAYLQCAVRWPRG